MPTKPKDAPSDAEAAVAEVAGEKLVSVEFNGQTYTFKRKRCEAVQLRLLYQKRRDLQALEWLLSEAQFATFLAANSDDDGCTAEEVYREFSEAIGAAVGAGNS